MSQPREPIRLGVVGCGYWGVNYLRTFDRSDRTELVAAAELSRERGERALKPYPGVRLHPTHQELLAQEDLDALVVSTRAVEHYPVVRDALDAGLHVLAEKPLTVTVEEAEDLVRRADTAGRILMVGHTFLYNSAIRRLKELLDQGRLGSVYYLHATRTNLGPIREDVDAMWDLATHDLSIFQYLLGAHPVGVSAQAGRYLKGDRADVVFLTCTYPGGVLGQVHASWLNASKVREVVLVGSEGRMVFDDLNNLEKIRIFEKGIGLQKDVEGFGEFQYLLRDGDIVSPKLDLVEPLRFQCDRFLDSVLTGEAPISDGRLGLEIVRTLCAAEESLRRGGAYVPIEPQE